MGKNKKIIHVNAYNACVQSFEIDKFIKSFQNQEKKLPFSISHVDESDGLNFTLSINKDVIKADLNDSKVQNFMSYDNLKMNFGSILQLFYFDKDAKPTPTDVMFDKKCERSTEDNFLTDDFLKRNEEDFKFKNLEYNKTSTFNGYAENLKFLQSKYKKNAFSRKDANQFVSNAKPSSCFNLSSITEFFKKVINFILCGMLCKDASKNK